MATALMMDFICSFCLFKRMRERKGIPRTTELRDSWDRSSLTVSQFLETLEDTDDSRGGAAWARGSAWLWVLMTHLLQMQKWMFRGRM